MTAGPQRTVLVVEDEYAIAETLQELLEAAGHRVVMAGHGAEALLRLDEGGIDVVLMDIMMPVLDGPGALARIRADARFVTLPVILMSAASTQVFQNLGAVDHTSFLRKPFSIAALMRELDKVLRRG